MKVITLLNGQWKTCNCSPNIISLQCVDFYPNSVVIYSRSPTKQPMVDNLPLNSLHIFLRAVILFIDILIYVINYGATNKLLESKPIICKQMTFTLLIKHDK